MKSMQKEKLTRENIKQDLYKKFHVKPTGIIILAVMTVLTVSLMISATSWMKTVYRISIPSVAGLLLIIAIIYDSAKHGAKMKALKKDDFIVETDELIETIEGYTSRRHRIPYRMRFYSGCEFRMYDKYYDNYDTYDYYTWSKDFSQNIKGIFNHAQKGDRYYIIRLNNPKRADMIYSTKMFELVEEPPKEESKPEEKKYEVDF